MIVIGAGLNGLVAAARLARFGLAPLVLEWQPVIGGAAVTTEIRPGFRVPRLSHALGPLRRDIVRSLRLDRSRAVELLTPDPSLTTLGPGAQVISFHPDPVLTAASINLVSSADAARWREFLQTAQRIARVGAELAWRPAPSLDASTLRERWQWIRAGRRARRLGRRDRGHLARWTMSPIGDVLDEWFDHGLVKGAIAARALLGNFAGPRSPGTGGFWLQRLAEDPSPVGSGSTARGGPGAISAALVATIERAGGAIRTSARVTQIVVRDGRASGVVLESGEEIDAPAIVSAIDPRQTLLDLVEADELTPTFRERMRGYRARGVTAKINLALSEPPDFPALRGDPAAFSGRLLIAPDLDYLERAFDAAKYGAFSPSPWLELSMPSASDPSLAPEGQHVLSIYLHCAPRHLRDAVWADQRDALYRAAMQVLEPHAPRLESLVLASEVITPEDLERDWGLSGGHIFHGEPSLDQSWIARPLLGWAHHRTPIDRLFLASAGTHPGGGLTGASGWLAAEAVRRAGKP
jgi:phytoene dehydrogenase-like protein